MDHYLERERGVHDASKDKSVLERELQAKALLKGQRKAGDRSAINAELGRKEGVAHAREQARDAISHGHRARRIARRPRRDSQRLARPGR